MILRLFSSGHTIETFYGRGQQSGNTTVHAKPGKNLINIFTGEDIEPICISGFVVLY